MDRKELVRRTSATTGVPPTVVDAVLAGLMSEIAAAMVSGESVRLRDFGKFEARTRAAVMRRNPATGEPVAIPRRVKAVFSPSSTLRDEMNA